MAMTVQSTHSSSIGFQQAYEDCCKADTTKDTLFKQMFDRIRVLEASIISTNTELEKRKDMIELYFNKAKQREEALSNIQQEISTIKLRQEQSNIVLVLIDGDIMLFLDEYVQKGEPGGLAAARELRAAVKEHMDSITSSCKIMVNIFANLSGLGKAYHGSCDIQGFVRGFNKFDGLYNITDAGNGKECADEKVKRNFELFVDNVQCQRIYFGGSGDNGYARLLNGFVGNERILLIEGPPFAGELTSFQPPFETIKFNKVFRSAKTVSSGHGNGNALSSSLEPRSTVVAALPLSSTPQSPSTWASAVATSSPSLANEADNSSQQSTRPSRSGFKICRNIEGKRIDKPLDADPLEILRVKPRRLCNQYHLLDRCPGGGEKCGYTHGSRLSDKEFLAQRALARKSCCFQGSSCNDAWCVSGHHCPDGKRCKQPNKCFFPKALHDVDTRIVFPRTQEENN